jgi:hypothetical protein
MASLEKVTLTIWNFSFRERIASNFSRREASFESFVIGGSSALCLVNKSLIMVGRERFRVRRFQREKIRGIGCVL